jgi:DNA-binding transcriptional ArsR family regulator
MKTVDKQKKLVNVRSEMKKTLQNSKKSPKMPAARSPFNKITYQRNAVVYRILANPVRLEILNILKLAERTVEELLSVVPISKANMSQHLAVLRHNGLVTTRRKGLNVCYSIVDPRIVEPCAILRELRHDPR